MSKSLTTSETLELRDYLTQSLRIRLAEVGARSCHTGLSQSQVKEILLYSALSELHIVAASWNIQHIPDFSLSAYESDQEKQKELFNV